MFRSLSVTQFCRTFFRSSSTKSASSVSLNQDRSNYGWQIDKYHIDQAFDKEQVKFSKDLKRPIIYSPNDLLIEVKASSVNPIDLALIKGYGREIIDNINVVSQVTKCKLSYDKFPLVLGRDFAGVVKSVGGNVTKFKVGEEVWGSISPFKQGSHCRYVVASENELTLKPSNLSFEEAASIPYVALTSWASLFKFGNFSIKNAPSKRVLILGASGGLGSFTLQLLKAFNCSLSATCSSNAVELVNKLGVELNEIYDYKNLDGLLNERKDYYDYILDYSPPSSANKTEWYSLLKKNSNSYYLTTTSPLLRNSDQNGLVFGLLKSLKEVGELTLNNFRMKINARWAYYEANQTALEKVKELCESNSIKPIVQHVFSLDQLPQAYETVSNGHLRGKVVIKMD